VFESIRSPGELTALRRLPGFILVSVEAPRELRFERQHARRRGDELDTFETFSAAEDAQLEGGAHEQQLLAVMAQADIQIVNIGNLDELAQTVRDQLNL
jgi:dephospho-CoA kinase